MICPFCKSKPIKVDHVRAYETVNFRERRCPVCGKRFKTTEEVISDDEGEKSPLKPK